MLLSIKNISKYNLLNAESPFREGDGTESREILVGRRHYFTRLGSPFAYNRVPIVRLFSRESCPQSHAVNEANRYGDVGDATRRDARERRNAVRRRRRCNDAE